jgi:nucleotide-binding universal stress UspA family protein
VHCAPEHLEGDEDDRTITKALDLWSTPATRTGVVVEQSLIHADPRTAIPELVNDIDAELVVLGTRGEGGFPELPLGRVARHVLHHVDVPVAIVPRTGGPLDGGTVVVGVDGSDANRTAVGWAVEAAASVAGRVDAVFVHDPIADSYGHGPSTNWKYRGQQQAEQLFASLVQPAANEVPSTFVNRAGHPVETLASIAAERDASMIVIGTRGHWSFGGRALGHVATQLPSHSPCPVVIVPHE